MKETVQNKYPSLQVPTVPSLSYAIGSDTVDSDTNNSRTLNKRKVHISGLYSPYRFALFIKHSLFAFTMNRNQAVYAALSAFSAPKIQRSGGSVADNVTIGHTFPKYPTTSPTDPVIAVVYKKAIHAMDEVCWDPRCRNGVYDAETYNTVEPHTVDNLPNHIQASFDNWKTFMQNSQRMIYPVAKIATIPFATNVTHTCPHGRCKIGLASMLGHGMDAHSTDNDSRVTSHPASMYIDSIIVAPWDRDRVQPTMDALMATIHREAGRLGMTQVIFMPLQRESTYEAELTNEHGQKFSTHHEYKLASLLTSRYGYWNMNISRTVNDRPIHIARSIRPFIFTCHETKNTRVGAYIRRHRDRAYDTRSSDVPTADKTYAALFIHPAYEQAVLSANIQGSNYKSHRVDKVSCLSHGNHRSYKD
jgi:hypothetical protein